MKKTLKNRCRKRYGKGVENPKKYYKNDWKWGAGGSRGMLASCTAPSPALNPQIIAHPFKGKGACGKQKEGKVRRRCVMKGCIRGKCPEKDAQNKKVRAEKGASTLSSPLPFGREAARGRISVACGNGSAPGPL